MMDFLAFINNAALLLTLSMLSSNIQHTWLKKEPIRSIVLGAVYGLFSVIAMSNPMELQPGVFFDGRSVILSLAGLFSGNLTTAIACLIAAAARFYFGGQGVFTGIGSVIISGLVGIVFRRIVEKREIRLNFPNLFMFGLVVHSILVLWFFTFPLDIALSIIRNVALPYLIVFPLATMLIGGYMEEQMQRLIIARNLAVSEKRLRELASTLEEKVEKRTRALKDTQEQLVKAEKMAALGEMAGSVGHELRNPLAVISNTIYLLRNRPSNMDEQMREYISMIEKETLDASRIIIDLLDYSRIQSVPKEEVNISALLTDVLGKQTIPENIALENNVKENLPSVNGNPQQLGQILTNLISNAVEAMPEGGTLKLSSSQRKEALLIHVEDTGRGIPQSDLKKIFEPLYTTKTRGVGLGLAITNRLAELNGISIRVKSRIGIGTEFSLVFPARRS